MVDFHRSRVVITGGMGFIGSNLALRLADAGAEVLVIDSLVPEYGGNPCNLPEHPRVRVNISDVRDPYSLPHLIRNCDYLFNLAGQTSHMDSMEAPETDLAINCRAQLSILEACRKHNPEIRLVYASTRQIYGRPDYLPVDERHPVRPVDINGIHKLSAELYHTLYNQVYGLRTTNLRLTNTIGPRMRVRDARQTFVGVWIRRILEGRPFAVWGGEQLRDFNDVEDVIDAMLLAVTRDVAIGETYNLGSDDVISLGDLARMLVEVNGGGEFVIEPFPAERRRIDVGDYHADWSKAQRELGWQPRIPLRDCLERTLAYFRQRLPAYVE